MVMGSLDIESAVEGGDGRFTAQVSRDWEIWGPNGGFLAMLALRAAGAHTDLRRPASFSCHFLGEVEGLTHDGWTMPAVESPRSLQTVPERIPEAPTFPFWHNLECRPCDWIDDWENRPAGEFHENAWYRFRPTATFDDPFVDAGRSLLVLDTVFWPVAMRGHPDNTHWYAPSIDVQARFHALEPSSEFLLTDAHSPSARDGLVSGVGSVWSESGVLLATGGQQMLCRPRALNPNPEQRA